MSKPLVSCFIPKSTDNTKFICLLCDYTTDANNKNYVGYCNHVKYKHVLTGNIGSLKDYFAVAIEGKGFSEGVGKCKNCTQPTEFRSIAAGYKTFCSHGCSVKDVDVMNQRKHNSMRSLLEKHGVENPSQIKGHSTKVKATKLEKYGNENYVNSDKAKHTLLARYGVESYTKTDEYRARIRKISQENYGGVDHFTQTSTVKDKIKQTCLVRYGVEHAMQSPEIKNRIKQTVESSVGWTLQKEENREKCKVALRKKTEERIQRFNITFDNVKVVSILEGRFCCLVCMKEFQTQRVGTSKFQPRTYPRCPGCFPVGKKNKCSLFHQEFLGFLIGDLGIDKRFIVENDTTVLKDIDREIDVYIPDRNIAFELNGNIWHTEVFGGKHKHYHSDKTNQCSKQGVSLVQVFEDEWDNKKQLVKEKIAHILGLRKTSHLPTVFARKCLLQEISASTANRFLQLNHVQGPETNSCIRVGAWYENRLVAVMTFGKPRLHMSGNKPDNSSNTYELIRFATDLNVRVVGIGSRLFAWFIKTHNPNRVVSYADNRWTTTELQHQQGTVYDKLGFVLTSRSEPNYFYVHPMNGYRIRENRFKYRRSQLKKLLKLYNSDLTEWENMRVNGYDRIWDCGTAKYVWARTASL